MSTKSNRKQINSLVFLFSVTYMISYITRINYGAIISEMQTATGFSKSLLSMALTGSFVTYGVGQIISGVCGDKIPPQKLISCGLAGAALMNILIPFCSSPYQMLLIWSINGLFQSFLWPPIVKIMTAILSETDYQKSISKVSWGSSFGTIIVYLLSPILIGLFHWKAVFFFSGILGAIMVFTWKHFASKYLPSHIEKRETAVCSDNETIGNKSVSLFCFSQTYFLTNSSSSTCWISSSVTPAYLLINAYSW